MIGGRPSRGTPAPLNMRPRMSRDTGSLNGSSRKHPGPLEVEFVGALEDFDEHGVVGGADDQAGAQAPVVVAHLYARAGRYARYAAHDDQAALGRGGCTEFDVFHGWDAWLSDAPAGTGFAPS